jgi:tripartite-type tricarboxylate transporter receptor subunit TctC
MIGRRSFLTAALATVTAGRAAAQPGGDTAAARPLTLVVPFPPGGPTDLIARRLALAMRDGLDQVVVVENRAGAGGNVGAEYVARARPDGQTVLFGTSGPLAINKALYPDQTYDPTRDFAPVAPLGRIPNVLAVNPGVPARSVQELIALARGGRKFTYGSSGNGASSHLAGALFNRMAGTDFEHVPYRGTGPALNDLLAGHIDMVLTDVMTALPHVQEGRLRALGVTTVERSAALPNVPTVAEQGLAGYDASVFFGIVVPAATPAEVRERLRAAVAAALTQPEVRRALEAQGMQIASEVTPASLAALMTAEAERWAVVIRETGARAD